MDFVIGSVFGWVVLIAVGTTSLGVPALFWMHRSHDGRGVVRVWAETLSLAG